MKRWVCIAFLAAAATSAGAKTRLGVEGTHFTINGKPTFLVGISYYGALGAPKEFVRRDLDDMQRYGFNWIRVWATWSAFDNDVSAVDGQGNPRKAYLDKLRWLVGECDRRGMIVDVTLSRGDGINGRPRLRSPEALQRAVRTLVVALKPYRNWYLDAANERNVRDRRYVSIGELAEVGKIVKQLDAERLFTASHAGDVGREELRNYLLKVRVDFIAPHRPRNPRSPGQTEQRTKRCLEWMGEIGRTVPVHYQEPFRRGYIPRRWEPRAEDFLADLAGALRGGAAGWCFHNGDQKNRPRSMPRRSFDMRKARLFDQLDDEETKFVRRMKGVLKKEAR